MLIEKKQVITTKHVLFNLFLKRQDNKKRKHFRINKKKTLTFASINEALFCAFTTKKKNKEINLTIFDLIGLKSRLSCNFFSIKLKISKHLVNITCFDSLKICLNGGVILYQIINLFNYSVNRFGRQNLRPYVFVYFLQSTN